MNNERKFILGFVVFGFIFVFIETLNENSDLIETVNRLASNNEELNQTIVRCNDNIRTAKSYLGENYDDLYAALDRLDGCYK